jgi:DNA-binding HxlR family transcriptional regulator
MTHEKYFYMLQREDFLRVVTTFQGLANGKHKLRIAWELRDKPLRYGDLKRAVNAAGMTTIAERVFGRELKALAKCGLVKRTAHASLVPKVEYSITALAESLLKLKLRSPYQQPTDWVFASPKMKGKQPRRELPIFCMNVARPGGLELPTFWFVARRSIQLSYGRAGQPCSTRRIAQPRFPVLLAAILGIGLL